MIGRTISHYRILEKLGEGGMGSVYKAEDTKLGRLVALKVLPAELSRDRASRERFIHEAKAASSLDHPNICTIYEIDEVDGRAFIAMGLVEGQDLVARIQAGPLKVEEAVDIAIQVADGLQAAHESGIVHRDIKSANLMIDGNHHVKITDFGLALKSGETRLTQSGMVVGTAPYMSPEQSRREDVDTRTDIWSLGVVLYETLSGRLPFRGEHMSAVVYSIQSMDPEPLTSVRTGVPMELEKIVERCLEKDPADRFQTAGDLASALRRLRRSLGSGGTSARPARSAVRRAWPVAAIAIGLLATIGILRLLPPKAAPPSGKKMLVVLPFENLGSPDEEYFADGITEEITARLAAIHGLGVIARTSAMQYRGTQKPIDVIGDELGVQYVLEGTIRWQRLPGGASEVRVTPQLVRVSDATHLWAESYQEDLTGVFQVQSDIAEKVALALDITLLEPERRSLAARPTDNPEAYEFYLRGKDYDSRRPSEKDTRMAIEMFERAVGLDPGFAEAWAALARARVWLKWGGHEEELPKAEAAARKATELAPESPETHMALGDYYYYGSRDYDRAVQEYEAVRAMRPSQAEAIAAIGYIERRQGKWEEALTHFEEALELNPRDIRLIQPLGRTCVRMRRFPEAERFLDRAIALSPQLAMPYVEKAILYLNWDGDAERARSVMTRARSEIDRSELLEYNPTSLVRVLPEVYADIWDEFDLPSPGVTTTPDSAMFCLIQAEIDRAAGDRDEATVHFNEARTILEAQKTSGSVPGYLRGYLGVAYAGLGRKDEAIREGEKAVELLPISKDAFSGPDHVERLAEIYVRVGENDRAIDQLEQLLSIPSRLSPALLRLDPIWDPLRDDPRFRRLAGPPA